MTGSLSTAALLTGTAAGVVVLLTLGVAGAARRAGLAHPGPSPPPSRPG